MEWSIARSTRRGSASGSRPRMATAWAGWRSAFVLIAMSSAIYGDEPPPGPIGDAAGRPEAAPGVKSPDVDKAEAGPSDVSKGPPSRSDEATALRVETVERLKRIDEATAKDSPAGGKKMRPV